MNSDRDIEILKYLLQQILVILEYTEGYDEEIFLRDSKTKDAVLTRLIVIGEYGNRVNETTKNRFDKVDWRAMKLARNYYAHVYRGVDWILVWHVVVTEIPLLRQNVEHILEVLEKENNGKIN